jgi:endonuclease/exonuclease/phosphatase (EEP) superfamily protein YafD
MLRTNHDALDEYTTKRTWITVMVYCAVRRSLALARGTWAQEHVSFMGETVGANPLLVVEQ